MESEPYKGCFTQSKYTQFVKSFGPALFARCRVRFGLQPADAADVVQETFKRLLNWWKTHELDNGPAWCHTAARNIVIDARRSNLRQSPGIQTGDGQADQFVDKSWATAQEQVDAKEFILEVLDRLKPDIREIGIKRIIEGKGNIETASELGMHPSTSATKFTHEVLPVLLRAINEHYGLEERKQ